MSQESFSKKLYIPRDVEGAPNREQLDLVREVEQKLEANESFVGLAPFGSIVSGHSIEGSDLDLFALFDSKKGSREDMAALLDEVEQEFFKDKGEEIHFKLLDINPDTVENDLVKMTTHSSYIPRSMEPLSALARVIVGERAKDYRDDFKERIHALLDTSEQQNLAYHILYDLGHYDFESLRKRTERMPDVSEEEHRQILKDRLLLWVRRVENIWGVTPDLKKIDDLKFYDAMPNLPF